MHAYSRSGRCRTRTNDLMRNRTTSNEKQTHDHTTRIGAVRVKDATDGTGEDDVIIHVGTAAELFKARHPGNLIPSTLAADHVAGFARITVFRMHTTGLGGAANAQAF